MNEYDDYFENDDDFYIADYGYDDDSEYIRNSSGLDLAEEYNPLAEF
jgi:hypothetical protein